MNDEPRIKLRFSGRADDINFESPPTSYVALADIMNTAMLADEIKTNIAALDSNLRPTVEISFSEGSLIWQGIVSLDWQGVLAFAGTLPSTVKELAHGSLAPFIAAAHIFELGRVVAEIVDRVIGSNLKKAHAPRVIRHFHTVVASSVAMHPIVIVNAGAASRWWSPSGVSQLLFGFAAILAATAALIVALSYHGRFVH